MLKSKIDPIIHSTDPTPVKPKPGQPIPVEFSEMDQFQAFAWLCTAILTHLDLGIRLLEAADQLINQIRTEPATEQAFREALKKLTQPNEYELTELSDEEGQRLLTYMFPG